MFKKIMVPVDLAHRDRLDRTLKCAGDLAAHYGATVCYVGATTGTPSAVAHTPKEYAQKLEAFAKEQAAAHGITAQSHAMLSHDPTTDIDDVLMKAVAETEADLVLMQSHIPGAVDYIWPSNGGKIAEHVKCSVMIVRG